MGSITIKEYDYGHPKNEDYAYDCYRQSKVDEEMDAERNQRFIEDTRLEARDNLRTVIAAYDRAVRDGHTMPTILMAAVEMARVGL